MSATRRGALIFGFMVLVVAFLCVGPAFFWLPQNHIGVPLPAIALPGEAIIPNGFFGQDFTNTLSSLVIVDLIVLATFLTVRRALAGKRPDQFVPRGFTNFIEFIMEFLYNQAKDLLGKNTMRVFPMAMSIFLFLLIANWIKLIPGVESVGIISCAEVGQAGYPLSGVSAPYSLDVSSLSLGGRAGAKTTEADAKACEEKHPEFTPPKVIGDEARGVEEAKVAPSANSEYFTVIPFFRPLATDLNLPLALALIVVVMVQVWGVQALGLRYFFKYINIPALGNLGKNPMGAMDFVVGLFEIVSEISRIISLSFRLFGNIFAGGILLIVMTFLMAGVLPSAFYFLEIFVGMIQAYVFCYLTIVYASQAMTAHHGDEEHTDHESHTEAALV